MNFFATINDSFHRHPNLPAIEDGGRWYTWRELGAVAARLDAVLCAAKLGPGSRIGLVARNRMPHVAALYGLLATRRTTAMVHSAFSPQALAQQIEALQLPAILADAEDWTSETIAAATRTGTLALRPTTDPLHPIDTVVPAQQVDARPAPAFAETAIEMLSSGTTGQPKRVPMRWDTLQAAAEDAMLNFRESGLEGLRDDQPVPLVQPAPLGNIGGLYAVIPAGVEGRPLVLLEKFTVGSWLDAVERHRPLVAWLAPASIQALWDADVPAGALSSIVGLRTGSAPLSAELQRNFERKFGLSILVTYGATEFCGVIAMWNLADHRRFAETKRGSAGRPRPGVELRIVDPQRHVALAPGQTGILEILAARIGTDWLHTNDLASLDEDGFLYLRGRADDAINRGGFKVMPETVAEAIARHPAVADVAVVGLPDSRLGQIPVAAIVLRDGRTLERAEMARFLRSCLPAYQIPARFLYVTSLPRTASLKIDRMAVRALFDHGD